jgi:hypothetical protein
MRSKPTARARDLRPGQFSPALVIAGLLLAGAAGCAPGRQAPSSPPDARRTTEPPSAPAVASLVPTLAAPVPAGWETLTSPRFPYSLSFPTGMQGTENGDNSWTLGMKLDTPGDGARNFVYLSVIPAGFQTDGGDIYNYNTPDADMLLDMRVGESQSLHEGEDTMPGFTYTRMMNTMIGGQEAKTYENAQPWEFPEGTKEIRYFLQVDPYTYLIGGYIDTTGTNPPGAITQAAFDQIVATFRVLP